MSYEVNYPVPEDFEPQTEEERLGAKRMEEMAGATTPPRAAEERVIGPTWETLDVEAEQLSSDSQ